MVDLLYIDSNDHFGPEDLFKRRILLCFNFNKEELELVTYTHSVNVL